MCHQLSLRKRIEESLSARIGINNINFVNLDSSLRFKTKGWTSFTHLHLTSLLGLFLKDGPPFPSFLSFLNHIGRTLFTDIDC